MIEVPVLIVGGGPVGLALAADLGWRGVDCLLVEQSDGIIRTPKMNEVNIRTMEFCRRWGIADAVQNCPFPDDHPMDVVFVTAMDGYELARLPRPSRRDDNPGTDSPMVMQACSQTWFDPILQELARSFSGVKLNYRCRMESFESDVDGVTAQLTHLDSGKKETIRARYLAACDGAGSSVRRQLGIGLQGKMELSRPLHMYFKTPDLFAQLGIPRATFYLAIDRGGLWANVRIIDPRAGLWRLMLLDTPPDFDAQQIDCDAYLRRAFKRPPKVEWVGHSVWVRRGVVAERYSAGRVHLLGDAVHQVSPTGALGMNTGIADAVDLGWKLEAVEKGWGGSNLLASYDAERRPAGARNVRHATGFYQGHLDFEKGIAAIEEATPEGNALREKLGPQLLHGVGAMFRTKGVQLGYRYDDSPLCIADGTPTQPDEPDNYVATARPGARAPHAWLEDGRSTLDLFGRGFTLLRLGTDAPDGAALIAAADARGLPLTSVAIADPDIATRYEKKLVLVRPDGHVAWRGHTLPAEVLALVDRVRGATA
ncbi:MAG: FAD-dependent monooxygenase [Burkholderiales bacterium]